jgi:lysozyme
MTPKSKPKAPRPIVLKAAYDQWRKDRPKEPFPEMLVVGVRGYYRDTMGQPGVNDFGIYDDALFVIGPETFASFNANTDPSRLRREIAQLLTGCHPYKPGNHGISRPGGGYPAFRPATKGEELPVRRHGDPVVPSRRPGVAINIHRGSRTTTSSEGCQTIHPSQWDAFYAITRSEMAKAGLKQFWYVLVDGPIV